jgi:hypothetical protein
MDSLICCDCKNPKEINSFYKNQKRCKDCTKIRNKKFKQKNPEYYAVGGKGDAYSKIENLEEYNKSRYSKYKSRYKDYNLNFRQSPRGALYSVLEAVRGRARKAGYSLDFDLDYLITLFDNQKGKCAATGICFDFSNESRSKRFRPFSVSVDRINSFDVYKKENIRLVCVAFNLAVNSFGDQVFETIAKGYLKCLSKSTE